MTIEQKDNQLKRIDPVEREKEMLRGHLRAIDAYLENAELCSVRFKAFADYADCVKARTDLDNRPSDVKLQLKLALIEETIRQRDNEVDGYRKEFETAQALGGSVSNFISFLEQKELKVVEPAEYLIKRKNIAIDKKGNIYRGLSKEFLESPENEYIAKRHLKDILDEV